MVHWMVHRRISRLPTDARKVITDRVIVAQRGAAVRNSTCGPGGDRPRRCRPMRSRRRRLATRCKRRPDPTAVPDLGAWGHHTKQAS
jgi:hypothetical protein